jgi:hypothetical protein
MKKHVHIVTWIAFVEGKSRAQWAPVYSLDDRVAAKLSALGTASAESRV